MPWEVVMGLEVHVELATKTKIFCGCTTEFGGAPNTHCCPVCAGLPGTLPVLNEKVLEYALQAGIALNCEITKYTKFDRKNYFYPDLPKAYQISQLYLPIARNGHMDVKTRDGETKTVRIREIHMEEDAGKLVHSPFGDETYPDFNRCGVPLIEIVSEPDFRSAGEVTAYLEKLKSILSYLGISDCKMEEGSMRADVNLSVRKAGDERFGTRAEMKNINSFKAIERAIAYEAGRQIDALEAGETLAQETRRWDDGRGITYAMRSKENAPDYRYFPEPDIPPVSVDDARLSRLKAAQPEMAEEKRERYTADFGLSPRDAQLLTGARAFADLFDETVAIGRRAKETANWIIGQVMRLLNEKAMEANSLRIPAAPFAALIAAVESGNISRKAGHEILALLFDADDTVDISAHIEKHRLAANGGDEAGVLAAARKIISENPKTVAEYKAGKTKVTGFFVGQTMKELKGGASPELVSRVVSEELGKQ